VAKGEGDVHLPMSSGGGDGAGALSNLLSFLPPRSYLIQSSDSERWTKRGIDRVCDCDYDCGCIKRM